jgi:hypothetical protein
MPRFALPAAALTAATATAAGFVWLAAGLLPVTTDTVTVNPDVHTSDTLWPPVNTYEEALVQCRDLSTDDTMRSDCEKAAEVAWPEEVSVTK